MMKAFGTFVASTLLIIVGMSILLGIQWLGWHGPKFLMISGPADNSLILSPLVFVPGLVLAIGSFAFAFIVWDKK